jgi:hypothetical protein
LTNLENEETPQPEYALYENQSVRVLYRLEARADCRVCGGHGWLDHDGKGGDCEYCQGTGKEVRRTMWAKVGYLFGPKAGSTAIVLSSVLTPLEAKDVTQDAPAS